MTSKESAKRNPAKTDYAPAPRELAAVNRAAARVAANTTPRLKILSDHIAIDHPDRVYGELLMMEALGAGDLDFMHGLLKQMANASSKGKQSEQEDELNFMVSVVIGIGPRDQVEAMLATQMAAVHLTTMRSACQLAYAENPYLLDSAERVFNKLTRTFPAQMETLKRYRAEPSVATPHASTGEGGKAIARSKAASNGPNQTATARDGNKTPAATGSKVVPMKRKSGG